MMTYPSTQRSEQLSCAFAAGRRLYKLFRMNGFFRLPAEANFANGEKSTKAV